MKSVTELKRFKEKGDKISLVTCYDYWSANILKGTPVDALLVGDSVSMVMHGFDSTIHATVDMMATHTAAVARARTGKLIISDLPFLAHRTSRSHLMKSVDHLMKAGAQALKMETAPGQENVVRWIAESGVPMIGHVGLTPQFVHQFGGYKVQGRDSQSYQKILQHSKDLEEAGCSAIVLECVPSELAREITSQLSIPTIGIGAGPAVDGQVLVLQDLLGFNMDFKPKFVRQFAQGHDWMNQALTHFTQSVQSINFPKDEETFQ